MPAPKLSRHWIRRLAAAKLWPVLHTAAYYRRLAAHGPDFLVRAVLRRIADGSD